MAEKELRREQILYYVIQNYLILSITTQVFGYHWAIYIHHQTLF